KPRLRGLLRLAFCLVVLVSGETMSRADDQERGQDAGGTKAHASPPRKSSYDRCPHVRGLASPLACPLTTSCQNVSWGIPAPACIRCRAASRIAWRWGEWANRRRSNSSSSPTASRTATGLPLRVTTTGPCSVAFRYAPKWAFTSAVEAIFIVPPPSLPTAGPV